jgi:ribA/ribD-fused uncharacterized protein
MIDGFEGPYRFLSNFFKNMVEYEGLTFPSVEHAYQAAKCEIPADRIPFTDEKVKAGSAKAMGRNVPLRPNWNDLRIPIMKELLRQKFSRNGMRILLQSTGNEELIEGNHWHDNFWGYCHCQKCSKLEHHNNLGKLLMEIRKETKNVSTAAAH